jgi:hypothetical protein
MWYTLNTRIYIFFFINWTLRMSDNLPERVQILCHAHIICITVLENRIICCQIFCDLLLKSAFEWIFNVMQLILVKGILSTKIVIFSYPKLLSFSVLTFIKWILTPSYVAKDTIFWQKRPKTIVIRIIVLDDNIQIYSYGLLCEPVLSIRTV